jgi:hypothetical protein
MALCVIKHDIQDKECLSDWRQESCLACFPEENIVAKYLSSGGSAGSNCLRIYKNMSIV